MVRDDEKLYNHQYYIEMVRCDEMMLRDWMLPLVVGWKRVERLQMGQIWHIYWIWMVDRKLVNPSLLCGLRIDC